MRVDFLNLPEKAMNFVCRFLDDRSLMRMRMVNHSTQEFMDFDSMKHIKTEINCMKMDLRILNPRNHIDMDLYIICPLDRALWKNCINFLLKKLHISNGFEGFNSHSLYYRVVNTDLQKLLDCIKPILEKETVNYFQIRGFDLALTRVCNALLEGMHVPYFLFEIDQLTMPHLNLFCEMVRQNTASSVELNIEKLNCDKETIQGLSRMFELTRKIFMCFGKMQYSKAHPDILSVVQHLMLEHCELFCLVLYSSPHFDIASFDEIEKIVQYLHRVNVKVHLQLGCELTPNSRIGLYRVYKTPILLSIKHEYYDFL